MEKNFLFLVIGLIMGIGVTVSATILYNAKDIEYTPSDENWNVNNIEEAINDIKNNYYSSTDVKNLLQNINSWNYSYTGNYQEFEVPITGEYKIELWGAQGGDYENNTESGNGDHGAYVSGNIELKKGTELFVYVGQGLGSRNTPSFNGTTSSSGGGNPGGGATDIRLVKGTWNEINSLRSRIIVAGGGGSNEGGDWGGAAGGLIGYSSSRGGITNTGATQLNGGIGISDCSNGSFGIGSTCGATGGGGYYGGGGSAHSYGSGSGGSSYISGHLGSIAVKSLSDTTPRLDSNNEICTEENAKSDITCSYHYSGFIFTDTIMIDGLGYEWTNEKTSNRPGNPKTTDYTTTENGHSGNGYARITLVSID